MLTGTCPLLGGGGVIVNDDSEKAETLDKRFNSTFGKKRDNEIESHYEVVTRN